MESRNILLIVICICAFLVLIFGIGFVWSLPDREREKPVDDENGSKPDIFEHIKDDTELPGLEPTEVPSEKMPIVYGEKDDEKEKSLEKDDKDKKESDAEKEGTEKKTEKEKDTIFIRAPRDDKPEYSTTWIVKPQPTPVPVPKPTKASRRLVRIIEYWIQAGSFQSRNKADTLNEKLVEHGFQGQVQTREIKSTTYYRVRIGPYQNKKEAEKFLEWMKILDGMEESYISEMYSEKWVN
ncbi:MAG: SPOR domain-containing protein [Spirochaetales bacterium]|nr:SPOR domain-containing protein [Spirochaetales bacterium]